MFPSAWATLEQDSARLERDGIQPHGTAPHPARVPAPLSPFPAAFHRLQRSVGLFPPLSCRECASERFFPHAGGGGLAGCVLRRALPREPAMGRAALPS